MISKVAIAGISSKLARLVVQELLKKPHVQIRGSSRDTSKLPTSLTDSPRVSIIQVDPYDADALRSLIHGCDVVICCYFADDQTMLDGQKLLIDLCEEESIERYIASDYTADFTKMGWGEIPPKDPMKHVKAYLDSKEKVNGVHILVGVFMETFIAYFNVWSSEEKKLRYWGTGSEKWDITSYQTAAEYVAAVALDSSATGVLKFPGTQTSVLQMAEDVAAVYGVKPELESLGSLSDLSLLLNSTNSFQDVITAAMYYTLTGKITLGENLDNARYPSVKPQTFRDFLKQDKAVE